MDTGENFLNITPVAQTLRATMNKWNLLTLRSFYKAKDAINKTKTQSNKWGEKKIYNNPTSDRELISKI